MRGLRRGRFRRRFFPPPPCRWTVKLPPDAADGLRDVLLRIRFRGDIGTLWLDGEMISDNFCNGDVWEVGLKEYARRLDSPMTLYISPLRRGTKVNVESPMAARSEEAAERLAQLESVTAQPVYELRL